MSNPGFLKLSNVSIRWKLMGGFGLMLLLTLLIGLMSYMGLQGIMHRVDQSESAGEAVRLMQQARIAEKNFIARDDDSEVNVVGEQLRNLQARVDSLEAQADNDQDRQQITDMRTQIGEYQRAFGQYVQSAQRQRELVTELRERAGSFIDQLDSLRDSLVDDVTSVVDSEGSYAEIQSNMTLANTANRANRELLQARVNEKNYMLFALPEYAAETRTRVSGITEALNELDAALVRDDRRVLLESSQNDLEQYQKAFETYIELNQSRKDMEEAMLINAREAMKAAADAARAQRTQMNSGVERTETSALFLPLIALLIGVVAALLITRSIVPPLTTAARIAREVAGGNLAVSVPNAGKDEVGQVLQALDTMVRGLQEMVAALQTSSDEIASAAEELSAVTVQTAEGVQEQKQEVDQVASAMTEMTASIQEVAGNAEQASNLAKEADESSDEGEKLVRSSQESILALASDIRQSADTVTRVRQNSNNVSTVLDVIKSIAEQTNLLALNAAIEAARAGDQGRGFAVVASEVRTLAQRTQESTTEIEQLISELQQGVEQAVTSMEANQSSAESTVERGELAAQALKRIAKAVGDIADMNVQIASAATQQSAASEQVSHSVQRISDIADQSASGSEETSRSSEELARLAQQLQEMTQRFRLNG